MVSRITAEELVERIGESADDAPFVLVDTRQEESFEDWHVAGAENVPFDPTEGFDESHRDRVEAAADGEDVVAICGKGLTSTPFGLHLEDGGYDGDVTVVRGGMEAFSTVHEVAEIDAGIGSGPDEEEPPDSDLAIYQLQRRATGCLGYLIGDRIMEEAIVVDPTRQIDRYAVLAEAAGLRIVGVVDTHVHADHLSGGPELAAALDVPYRLGVAVDDPSADHEYEPLVEGETIDLGDLEVRVLHTPGHTKEHVCLAVDDEYVLTADALHVDSVGRTELAFDEDEAERGAELLYESLHETLLELDDDVEVLPGHVSVTEDIQFETGSPGEPIRGRLGLIADRLDVLGYDRAEFVRELTEDLPEKPGEYETVIEVNAGRREVETEEEAAELETGPNSCSA